METTNGRIGHARRHLSCAAWSQKPGFADSQWFARFANGMQSQKNRIAASWPAFFVSLTVVLFLSGELFGHQAPAPPSTLTVASAPAKDELRISARAYHEDLLLKAADLKAMPRTTITIHNEHAKADETYAGVRASDVLTKMGAPLGKDRAAQPLAVIWWQLVPTVTRP
jgi:hypothetical protein